MELVYCGIYRADEFTIRVRLDHEDQATIVPLGRLFYFRRGLKLCFTLQGMTEAFLVLENNSCLLTS